uniref:Biogenic amine-like GPCR n=1 Tax=Tripedalia cystophora TaxID=6141 RepID=A0A481ZNC7_TRICY|nr:biogenic amine-like GPCR [Tripedalia cystophora]
MQVQLPHYAKVIFTVTFTIVIIMGVLMNIAVLLVFLRNKALRQHIANLFIITLACIDLLNLLVVMPFSLVTLHQEKWIFGTTFCNFNAFFDTLFGLASVLTLAIISIDRWVAVMKPLHYRAKMTVGRAGQLICCMWFQAVLFSVVPLFENWYIYNNMYLTCTYKSTYEDKSYVSYLFVTFILNLIIPLLIMLVTYFFIFKIARSHSRRIACAVVQMFNTVPMRQKIRNEGFRQREVRTAVKISFVIGAFLFCHVPYSIIRMVEITASSYDFSMPLLLTTSVKWVAYSKSSVNPFVYGLIQQRFRDALVDLLGRKAKRRRTLSDTVTHHRAEKSFSTCTLSSRSKVRAISPVTDNIATSSQDSKAISTECHRESISNDQVRSEKHDGKE